MKFVLLLVLAAAFCPGCKRSASENAKGVVKSHDGEEMVFRDHEGAEVHYAGGKAAVSLPAGFPSDAPLYPKAILIQTSTKDEMTCALLSTPDPVAKAQAYYAEKMKTIGWKPKTIVTAENVMFEGVKEGRKLIVLISKNSDGTLVLLTILKEK